jgi:hypothetical protein
VTDEDLFVTEDPSHVTDSNPPNHAQRDGVTDVTDKSLGTSEASPLTAESRAGVVVRVRVNWGYGNTDGERSA